MKIPTLSAAVSRIVREDWSTLTVRQLGVMLEAYSSPMQPTVRGLAQKLNISKPAVTRAISKLEWMGLVRRVPDRNDRRSIFVGATDEGRKFIDAIAA